MPPGGAAAHAAKLAFKSLGGKGAAVKGAGMLGKGAGMVLKGAGLVATGAAVSAGIDNGVEGIVGSTGSNSHNEQQDKLGSSGSWGFGLGMPSISTITSSSQSGSSRQNLVAGFFAANGLSTSTYPVAAAGKSPVAQMPENIAVTEPPKKKVPGVVDAYLAKVALSTDAVASGHAQTSDTDQEPCPNSSHSTPERKEDKQSKIQGPVRAHNDKQAAAGKEQRPPMRLPMGITEDVSDQAVCERQSVPRDEQSSKDQLQSSSASGISTVSAPADVPVSAAPASAASAAISEAQLTAGAPSSSKISTAHDTADSSVTAGKQSHATDMYQHKICASCR
jgi:hypothetical protein